jgi:hypothetical protein
MSSYISSNNNRFYVATESSYGMAAEIQSYHRIPAVKLKAKQEREHVQRRDKTGSRTFPGLPASIRRVTSFGLNTYMTGWGDQQREPAHGALFTAAMGGSALMFSGAPIASSNGTQIVFAQPHGLSVGQAIAVRAEIRFVVAVVDSATVQINAPFSLNPAGVAAIATATYRVANSLPSASIFDYWDPNGAVQRVVAGAAIDRVTVKVNGDFHEFEFSGAAADLVDSSSFTSGMAGLQQFPVEPQAANFDYSIIPGHLGRHGSEAYPISSSRLPARKCNWTMGWISETVSSGRTCRGRLCPVSVMSAQTSLFLHRTMRAQRPCTRRHARVRQSRSCSS